MRATGYDETRNISRPRRAVGKNQCPLCSDTKKIIGGVLMPQAQIVRIVVASPTDVQAERNILSAVVEELNNGIAKDRHIRLELARWETDIYPGLHLDGPQGLIDSIL